MQRYFLKRIDPRTYTIRDHRDDKVYFICVDPVFSKFANTYICVAEVILEDTFYATYVRETLSFTMWALDFSQVEIVLTQFFAYLHEGGDISNPADQNLEVGTMLHNGTMVSYPKKKVLH